MNWEGKWNLEVSTPIGKYPATLILERADEGTLSGYIDSQLGRAPLRDISENGDRFNAVVAHDVKGRTYEADVDANSSGVHLNGTIKVRIPLAPPAKFTGTRS